MKGLDPLRQSNQLLPGGGSVLARRNNHLPVCWSLCITYSNILVSYRRWYRLAARALARHLARFGSSVRTAASIFGVVNSAIGCVGVWC